MKDEVTPTQPLLLKWPPPPPPPVEKYVEVEEEVEREGGDRKIMEGSERGRTRGREGGVGGQESERAREELEPEQP